MGAIDEVECLVVGAGVVGLAAARALAMAGREVLVAEREPLYGSGTSSRNSEVIHAGLYYPAGSLKATLCVRGKALLYAHCAERGLPHRRCGKLLVACSEAELPKLHALEASARANGVDDLRWVEPAELRAMSKYHNAVTLTVIPPTGAGGEPLSVAKDAGFCDTAMTRVRLSGRSWAKTSRYFPSLM